MAIKSLIMSSFRKLGVVTPGNEPTANEVADAMTDLNTMLYNWSVQRNAIFTSILESFSLVSGTATYTWGSGGDFNSARPTRIIGCTYTNNSVDSTIIEITRENYMPIAQKSLESSPDYYLHEPNYPLASITFYPVPDSNYDVDFYSQKPLAQYSNAADDIALPPEYHDAIVYNLAARLAPEYVERLPSTVAALAEITFNDLKALHSQPIPQIRTGQGTGKYNIYKDS